ncbi:MAG: 3-hydroxybutyryl-CoA dehydratase, partial [Alphaproteobacteria bacterium]
MLPMPIADHEAISKELAETGRYVKVLWQSADTLMFVARGRAYRSEFHINPADEHMTMLKGTMNLHYRTPEGKEEVAVLKEGETIYTAAGIPHSPRFPEDAFLLVGERMRRTGETDSFQWYCPSCDALI